MKYFAIFAGGIGLLVFLFVNIFLKKDEGKKAIFESIQYILWLYIPFSIFIALKSPRNIFWGTIIGTISITINALINVNNAVYIYFYSDGILGKNYFKKDHKKNIEIGSDIAGLLKSVWIINFMVFFIKTDNMLEYSITGSIGIFLLLIYLFSIIRNFVNKESKILNIIPKTEQVVKLEVFTTYFLGVILLISRS